MTSDLLYYLYHLATEYGGEVHADSDEVVLCFPNSTPPKRMEDEPWPVTSASVTDINESPVQPTNPNKSRHRVLNDMDQFLKEQQLNQEAQSRMQKEQKAEKFRSGELPYRNYPEGRPPRQ